MVNLPHGLELLPASASGGVNYRGPAWYRKHFRLPDCLAGKRLQLQPASDAGEMRLQLAHLPPGRYGLEVSRVGFEKNDAYTACLIMGAPSQLTRAQFAQLQAASSGNPESSKDIVVPADGTFSTTLSLRSNDVCLVSPPKKCNPFKP